MKNNKRIIPIGIITIIIGATLVVQNISIRVRAVDFIHIMAFGMAIGIIINWLIYQSIRK